jgi:uncharacterized membrane protein
LHWYPIITFLRTRFDLPMATSVSWGYGHNDHPLNYLDAWDAVTDPAGRSDEVTQGLKPWLVQP